MTDLVVVGDALLDVAARAAALLEGGDVRGSVRARAGGQGANVAAWAGSEGLRVRLHARIGDDAAGRLVRESLEERGVEAALTVDPEAPTGTLLVLVRGGDRSMVADRGAAARLSPSDLPDEIEAGAVLVSGYLLFDQGSEAAGLAALERARARHLAVEASTWPLLEAYGSERFLEATSAATVLLANEREAEVLTGAEGEEAAAKLAERYEVAVVKLGDRGAALASAELTLHEPAKQVEVADPTGAGDAFDAAFLAALLRGGSLGRALDHAITTGGWVASREEAWP
ncbi:MAG TPA: PfkB family carbohydrate kinase [Actinomycetota bacterium]